MCGVTKSRLRLKSRPTRGHRFLKSSQSVAGDDLSIPTQSPHTRSEVGVGAETVNLPMSLQSWSVFAALHSVSLIGVASATLNSYI